MPERRHKRLATLLTLTALLMISACGDRPETAQDYVARAQQAIAREDIKGAVIDYKNAVQKSPSNPELRVALGKLYLRLEQGYDAEKEFLAARKSGMDNETLAPLLGEALTLNGDYQRILDLINPDTARSPGGKALMLSLQGDGKLGLGQLQAGCALYEQANRLDPNQIAARRGLGRCAFYKEGIASARAILTEALRMPTADATTWMVLGDLEYKTGHLAEAREAYSRALKTRPWSHNALAGYAQASLGVGQVEAAGQAIATLTGLYPDSLFGKALAALLDLHQGRVLEAYRSLASIREKNPLHLPTHAVYALAAYSLGHYDQAAGGFSRFLAKHPDNDSIRKLLVQSRMRMGQHINALESLGPMLRGKVEDPQAVVLAAELHLKLQQNSKAAEYIALAISMAGKGGEVQRQAAQSLLARKDLEGAIDSLKSYHGLASDAQRGHEAQIVSLLRSGQADHALALIADSERGAGDAGRLTLLKAQALQQKGDAAGARRLLEDRLASQPDDTDAAVALAGMYLAEGKLDDAKRRLQQALSRQPTHLQGLMLMSTLAHRSGSAKERRAWLEKAIAAHPASVLPLLEMAHLHLLEPNPMKALEWVRKAEQLNPGDPKILDALGTVQIAAGELNNALATYHRLATLVAPRSAYAHQRHAMLLLRVNHDRKGARFSLRKAIEYQPDLIPAYRTLVGIEIGDRHFDTALAMARKLQAQLPSDSTGMELEGDVLVAQGHHERAVQVYRSALDKFQSGGLAVKLHRTLTLAGQRQAAEDALNGWLDQRPDDLAARVYRADLAYLAGQPQQAVADLEAIRRSKPDSPLILNNLANLYHATGDPRALEMAERGYRLAPENAQMADTLGWILAERGDLKRAVPLLRKAQGLAADDPRIAYRLAAALAKSGAKTEARKQLETLLDSARAFPERAQAEALQRQLNR